MKVTVRKLQSLWVSASVAALLCTATTTALAQMDMDMAQAAADAMRTPSGPTFGELRQDFFAKIEKARAAVKKCGGCASAQAELDALLEEEEQFQSMAARAFTMTGAPPAVFRMFGIGPPSFADYAASFPSTYESGEGLVNTNPDWLKDAPEFCQQRVRDYLRALKTYQDRARSSEIDFLKSPGGAYYEESRIYRACRQKDYTEFERLVELRKARAAGQVLAEFEPVGAWNTPEKGTIYYGDVREDFMLPMPPADVVKETLGKKEARQVRVIANKKQNDNLTSAIMKPYSGFFLKSKSVEGCRIPRAERPERVKRHCEDLNEVYRLTPYLLQCGYRATGDFGATAHNIALYWYDERVELAKIEYLLPRDHNHPLLAFPDARSDCPATWQQASSELEAYQANLKQQRGKIAEIPMTQVLPESAWLRERREAYRIAVERKQERMKVTDAYELPGYYAFDYERVQSTDGRTASPDVRARPTPPGRPGVSTIVWDGQPLAGDCIVAAKPARNLRVYEVACWTDSQMTVGTTVQANGVTFSLGSMPSNQFLLDEDEADTLKSVFRGENITLRRKRDLVPMGEVPLEGDYLLQLASGGEYLRAHCTFDYTGGRKTYFRLNCIDDQGRYLWSSTIRSSTPPTAQMLPVSSLAHFPSWQAKYNVRARGIMLGGMGVDKLFAVVDPVFEGDSPRDAPLLLFGGAGITGSLQRIETSETTFGDDDPANVTGHWVGDFQCGQTRDMKAELYLKDDGKGRFRDVSGTFVFRNSRYGEEHVLSYAVAGQYLSGVGSLKLEPGEWIKTVQQYGYSKFGLRTTAFFTNAGDADGSARMQGDLTEKTCADIKLARVSRTVPESIVFESQPGVTSPVVAPSIAEPETQVAVAAGGQTTKTAAGAGIEIELPADSFMTGITVPITVSGLPGNSQDWVAISKVGQADNKYVSYKYSGGATEGTWSLKSGPPGEYEVRVYLNWPTGGYNPVLRRPIKVVSAEDAGAAGLLGELEIQLAARTFAPGQPIEVTVTGLPGNSQDWVAISRAGAADNNYEDYDYTQGVNQGTWTYSMSQPGDYEVRVYLNWPTGGYNPVLREPITVSQ